MRLSFSERYIVNLHKHLTILLSSVEHDIDAYYHLRSIIAGLEYVLKNPESYR